MEFFSQTEHNLNPWNPYYSVLHNALCVYISVPSDNKIHQTFSDKGGNNSRNEKVLFLHTS
jgi:hypothetical protein